MKLKKLSQKGFTIVELLIATAVLSVIILLATAVIINIGSLYYKGSTLAKEQEDARNIIDDVGKQIELSDTSLQTLPSAQSPGVAVNGGSLNVKATVYCVGTTRYTAVIGYQLGSQTTHVLWRDTVADNTCPALSSPPWNDPSNKGAEMIASGSMLTFFNISASSPYTIQVSVAYGDSTASSLLNINTNSYDASRCKGQIGDQFCATASLSTTVDQRI